MSDTVYLLLFRGVGGATKLPTKPLREALTAAGFENVATYINSGNALLKTAEPRGKMLKTVAAICEKEFGFTKAIYAPTRAEWAKLIANNPFAKMFNEGRFLHAAWLEKQPEERNVEALRALAQNGEALEIVGKVAYLHTPAGLHTPGGLSTSKLGVKFDKGLGVPNTARNWNTVLKLMELAEKAEK